MSAGPGDEHPQRSRLRLFALACAAAALVGHAAPKPADVFNASDETSLATIDHAPWQALLNAYLRTDHPSGVNRFDYGALRAHSADMARLAGYLTALQNADPRGHSRAEQKAYWINLYNALTVRLVAAAYPIDSIRDIGGSWLTPGPWQDVHANIAGRDLTLDNIEHDILRPVWRDPRIHYAVNCASYGCPNLSAAAFTAANTEELLEAGARAYVNHPRGVAFNGPDIVVSSIYRWYQEDFGGSEEGLLRHLIQYAAAPLAEQLRGFNGDVEYAYDWTLNAP